MPLNDKIRIIDRKLLVDSRGWFLKMLTGLEEFIPSKTGEIYMTVALPGEWRANHYHYKTDEWFTVFAGKAKVILEDVQTKERAEFFVDAAEPKTIFAAAGVAHVFINVSETDPMMLSAYASEIYDPADTCLYNLIG